MLCAHLMVSVAKLLGPGGTKGLLAETLLLKHQLLVLNRVHRKAPNLTSGDRIFMGLWSPFMKRGRIRKAAAGLSPVTLCKFHEALKKRQYRLEVFKAKQGQAWTQGSLARPYRRHRRIETT